MGRIGRSHLLMCTHTHTPDLIHGDDASLLPMTFVAHSLSPAEGPCPPLKPFSFLCTHSQWPPSGPWEFPEPTWMLPLAVTYSSQNTVPSGLALSPPCSFICIKTYQICVWFSPGPRRANLTSWAGLSCNGGQEVLIKLMPGNALSFERELLRQLLGPRQ